MKKSDVPTIERASLAPQATAGTTPVGDAPLDSRDEVVVRGLHVEPRSALYSVDTVRCAEEYDAIVTRIDPDHPEFCRALVTVYPTRAQGSFGVYEAPEGSTDREAVAYGVRQYRREYGDPMTAP